MKSFKLKIVILFSILIGIFPAYKLIAAVAASSKVETKDKNEAAKGDVKTGDAAKAAVEDVKKETKGNVIISSVIKIFEKITEKISTEINLGDVVGLLVKKTGTEKSDVEKFLSKYVIKTPVIKSLKKGIKINGEIIINNNPLTGSIEISKGDKDWVCIFYLTSPKKWKLTDYLPDVLNLKKMFPGVDAKLLQPDLFELEESYFYVSTTDIAEHEELGNIVAGAGFKGKLRFIGLFDIIDKIFALQSKPIEVTGALKVPKIVGSEFSIKIPTSAVIFPESIVVNGKTIKLIPDTSVKLGTHEFSIKITDDIPIIKAKGRIVVKLPKQFLKDELIFSSEIDFSGTRLKLIGGQEATIKDVFGIKDLDLSAGKIGLTWDFVESGKLAAQLGAATVGVGALAVFLPMGFVIEGGLKSGKSKLDVKADISVHGTKAVDLAVSSNGSLDAKDFAKFWLDVIAKNQNPTAAKNFINQVPPFIFEDVVVDAAWSTEKGKKLELKVGKVELLPGQSASMELKVSEDGISGSGKMSPVSLPTKTNPLLEITSKGDKKEGPSFSVDCTISPVKLALKSDARVYADLGPVLGKLDTATTIDVSEDGLEVDTATKFLDFDSNLKIKGKLDGKIEDWSASGGFDQKSTEKLSGLLKESSKALLKASEDISKQKNIAKNDIDKARDKAIKDIETEKNKAVDDIKKYFDTLGQQTTSNIDKLQKERSTWVDACNGKKQWWDALRLEKAACDVLNVWPRDIAIAALVIHRDFTLKIVSGVATISTQAALSVGQVFTAIGTKIGSDFVEVGSNVASLFTKVAGEITKLVEDFTSKVFKLNSFSFEAKIDDLKKLKFPKISYDAVIMGNSRVRKDLQLNLKKPEEFINVFVQDLISDVQAAITSKINSVETEAKTKITAQDKKVAEEISKAKADAQKVAETEKAKK